MDPVQEAPDQVELSQSTDDRSPTPSSGRTVVDRATGKALVPPEEFPPEARPGPRTGGINKPKEIIRGVDDAPRGVRGRVYREINKRGWADQLLDKEISQKWVAEKLGCTQSTVSMSVTAIREDRGTEAAQRRHRIKSEEIEDLTGYPLLIDIYSMDDEEIWELVHYFAKWRHKHFLTRARKPYETPIHQKRWAWLIFKNIRDGGKLLILSPPRHGKTELLIHIDLFMICRVDRNIALVKVCKSETMAKRATSSVLDHLSANDSLKEECLPEGEEFQPDYKSRRPWNALEMVIKQRDITGIKSPTLVAVGAGGSLLSRDGDVFSLDDVEDHHTTRTPENRQATREWAANDLGSREEAGTAINAIGSRQHPDDLWGHLIDNPEWDVVIEKAHDDAVCQVKDGDNPDNWDKHVDCMLWPEVRDYEWLMGVKNDPERVGSFVMTYQNEPQDADLATFTIEMTDQIKDNQRLTGQFPREEWMDDDGHIHRYRLIAGLDPSRVGHQAVFLWAYDPAGNKLLAVDFENERGGGIPKARMQIQDWYEKYGVATWVIEKNLFYGGIMQDELLLAYCRMHHIVLIDHETLSNKWDAELGVTAFTKPMLEGNLTIPWGDTLTQNKWEAFRRQLINFNRDRLIKNRNRKKGMSDIVMAAWFPWETIKRWRREYLEEVADAMREMNQTQYPFYTGQEMFEALFPSVFGDTFAGVR